MQKIMILEIEDNNRKNPSNVILTHILCQPDEESGIIYDIERTGNDPDAVTKIMLEKTPKEFLPKIKAVLTDITTLIQQSKRVKTQFVFPFKLEEIVQQYNIEDYILYNYCEN
jgi:hypothetical protein